MSTSYDNEPGVTICPDCGEDLERHTCGAKPTEHTLRIREQNDALRTRRDQIATLMMNGSLVITHGLASRGEPFIGHAIAAVRLFDDFTPDNDPHGEHDMAFLDVDGERIFFKVDYYDAALEWHSPDASDPGVTRRVLTIALAEEY